MAQMECISFGMERAKINKRVMRGSFVFYSDGTLAVINNNIPCNEPGCAKKAACTGEGVLLPKCFMHQRCSSCGILNTWSELLCWDCDHCKHEELPLCNAAGCTYHTIIYEGSVRADRCGIHNICLDCGASIGSANYMLRKCSGCKKKITH